LIALAPGVRVYLACGVTDMRKGMIGLAMLVQQNLTADPFDGAVYAFRGRRAGLVKLIWHDGVGLCMLTKRLERGQFAWPSATTTGRIALSRRNWRHCSMAASGGPRCLSAGRNSLGNSVLRGANSW